MYLAAELFTILLVLVCDANARGYGTGVGSAQRGVSGITGIGGIGGMSVIGGMGGINARSGAIGGSGNLAAASGGYAGGRGSFAGGQPRGYISGGGSDMSPKPFSVNYESPDGDGGAHFKTESGDGSGAVRGTYGYFDARGLYRIVEYFADQNGFTATIKTNEPGVNGKENPADVTMIVDPTPPGIQDKYTPSTVHGGIAAGGLGALGGGVGAGRGVGRRYGGAASMTGMRGVGGAVGVYPGAIGGVLGGRSGAAVGGFASGAYGGNSGSPGGTLQVPGSFGGSSGAFSGISRSSTSKSMY